MIIRAPLLCCLLALMVSCARTEDPLPAPTVETEHYAIHSTADKALTEQAGVAVERLFAAYAAVVGVDAATLQMPAKMRLRLYADRKEFKANNRSRPWAEGYYHQGVCYAYLDSTSPNSHHWMLHETVHQLNREITGFAKEKWLNEGLATYLGSSQLVDGKLRPGVPDLNAYPLWWLKDWKLSGNWTTDVEAEKVIPLRALITGKGGPPLDDTFNAHYIAYWSITHFLLHYDNRKYAEGYRHMLQHGGSLADFERHIGLVETVQAQWYVYLQAMQAQHAQPQASK